jgi:hypothetical protein
VEETEALLYVQASARAIGLVLDDARAHAVAVHFRQTAAIARVLDLAPLAPADELAEIYRPAPFPTEGGAA